jgi:hypothetical protein
MPSRFQSVIPGLTGNAAAQAGALGAVAAPWFVYLGQQTGVSFVPFVVFGSLSILAGLATPAMPETLGAPAAATVQVQLHACCPQECFQESLRSSREFVLVFVLLLPHMHGPQCAATSAISCSAGLRASQSGLLD